jgi:hypothetical protein
MTRSTSKSSNITDNTFPLAVPELEVELALGFEAEPVNKLELEPTEVPELPLDLSG